MLVIFGFGLIFAIGSIAKPLLLANKELPMKSWYPFDWSQSPIYEILYFYQSFVNFIVITIVCGYDNLFLCLCTNVAVQFELLQEVLGMIGHRKSDELAKKLRKNDEFNLLVVCVEHHQRIVG
jgi:7tm Odorant receptor